MSIVHGKPARSREGIYEELSEPLSDALRRVSDLELEIMLERADELNDEYAGALIVEALERGL